MSGGRLIAVVGPSGVGKDSLMEALAAARPEMRLVQRTITRPQELGGENFLSVTEAEFRRALDAGAFCLHWRAHDLRYGIPADLPNQVDEGQEALVNLSRGVLDQAQRLFPDLIVLKLTASPEVLAARLKGRGREDANQIAGRLAQAEKPLPEGIASLSIRNDGPLEETVQRALAALYPASLSC
ncbi:MAG: phosphonate metabolism protein/1,5-bisphosphokinase (PRPP-forming) PhnN [Sulfitobacter sp.]|nr:phosphonate metabolism protein/1,5-bisphosphokinase (PRPP-forming) PhnN [Sulfitobacter sp.]